MDRIASVGFEAIARMLIEQKKLMEALEAENREALASAFSGTAGDWPDASDRRQNHSACDAAFVCSVREPAGPGCLRELAEPTGQETERRAQEDIGKTGKNGRSFYSSCMRGSRSQGARLTSREQKLQRKDWRHGHRHNSPKRQTSPS